MLNIILTMDYEIFGDGAGDVKKHIIKPAYKILKICDKYSVPLTIMFEVNEYQKFIEYESELVNDLGYSPAQEMKKQILKAYYRGHDVQLHIHPQWVDAEYKNKKWIIKNSELSISEFSKTKINQIINSGKKTIEKIICEVDIKFSVCAMRLTNLPWVEAPVEVHDAMRQNKIYYHSLAVSDSLKNNTKGAWPLDSIGDIFEVPIHSVTLPGFRRFTWNRIKTALYRRIYTQESVSLNSGLMNQQNKNNLADKVKNILFTPQALKWDFCKQSSHEMLKFLDDAMARYDYINQHVPLIMIGHSKDFFNSKNLDCFFKIARNKYCDDKSIVFSTISKFCEIQKTI